MWIAPTRSRTRLRPSPGHSHWGAGWERGRSWSRESRHHEKLASADDDILGYANCDCADERTAETRGQRSRYRDFAGRAGAAGRGWSRGVAVAVTRRDMLRREDFMRNARMRPRLAQRVRASRSLRPPADRAFQAFQLLGDTRRQLLCVRQAHLPNDTVFDEERYFELPRALRGSR